MNHLFSQLTVIAVAAVFTSAVMADGVWTQADVDAYGSASRLVIIDRPIEVASDLTIGDNLTLRFEGGGKFVIAEQATLTVHGEIEAGLSQIFADEGEVTGNPKVQAIMPEWFYKGEYDNEDYDWAPAMNAAIRLADTSCKRVLLQGQKYNVNSTIDLAANPTYSKADLLFEGLIRSTQYQRGTLIIGNTGAGNAVIDTSDVDGIYMKNIGIIIGSRNPSSIGVLQARANQRGWAGDHYYENLYINMSSDPNANNGFGRVGFVNIAGEETKWHNLQIWANLPFILTVGNGSHENELMQLLLTDDDYIGTRRWVIASAISNIAPVSAHSNTVFSITGLSRLIAYDYVSPCMLINMAATIDINDTFMQMRRSNVPGVRTGGYRYAIENWNCWSFRHFGTVEGGGGYLLNRRGLWMADVTATIAGVGERELPVIMLYDGGVDENDYHRMILNCRFNLFSYDDQRPLVAYRAKPGEENQPCYFDIRNCEFKTTLNWTEKTAPDADLLSACRYTQWYFKDRFANCGDGTVSDVLPTAEDKQDGPPAGWVPAPEASYHDTNERE